MYLRGQPPPSVNMYWRKFAIKDIPLSSAEVFDAWLRERWYEKDALLEQFIATGRFPGNTAELNGAAQEDIKDEFIETEVKLANWWEVGNIFVVPAILSMFALRVRAYFWK